MRLGLVGVITLAVNYGTRNSFGLFLKPLAEEFAASRGTTSLILSLNFLTYGLVIMGVGWLVDRFGPRLVLILGTSLAAAAWWISAGQNSLGLVLVIFGVVFGVATAMLSQVTCTSLASKYLQGRRSSLLGYLGMGPAIGQMLFAPILGSVLAVFSWRLAMVVVGFFFVACLLLPALGLRGLAPRGLNSPQGIAVDHQGYKWWRLIAHKSFVLLFLAFMSMAFGVYVFLTQVVACAEDLGLGLATGAMALGTLSGTGILISPLVGWINSRLGRTRRVGIVIFLMGLSGLILMRFADSTTHFFLASVLVGIGYGGYVPVLPALAMGLYPQTMFGRLWGLITSGGCLGASLGSWLGGLIFDLRGDYSWAWLIAAAAMGVAALSLLSLPEDARAEPEQDGRVTASEA